MTLPDNINEPKVSIIIPVYNVKQYVAEAIESVINQTYKNIEIIVVDDGSNDGSEKICDEYAKKDARIKLIHQENRGLSAARNTGLDNITGEYIAFLDSDDAYYPEAIEKMLNSMLSHSADCVVCNYVPIDAKQKIKYKKFLLKKKEKIYSHIEALKNITNYKIKVFAWGKLYKQNIFTNIRYPNGQNYEDLHTILEVIDKTQKVVVINDKLICHRIRRGSICATISLKNFQDLYKADDNFELFIKKNIPDIYSEADLKKNCQHRLETLMSNYANALHQNFPDKLNAQIWLREKIRERNLNNEIKEYCLKTRLIFYLMFNFPRIFSILAFLYFFIRKKIVWLCRRLKIIL